MKILDKRSSPRPFMKSALISCAVLLSILGLVNCTEAQSEQRSLQSVATRLGVQTNWDSVTHRVYCEILIAGRSRQHIEESLLQVGAFNKNDRKDYDKGRVFEARYEFDDPFVKNQLKEIRVLYDSADAMTSRWQIRWNGLDTSEISVDCNRLHSLLPDARTAK